MSKLLIIDGNSLLNRAFYGVRALTNSKGFPTNAVYGFTSILKKHIDAIAPDHLVCAFDVKSPTFRHERFDGYKANRHGMPDELAMQLPYAKRLAAALGFKVAELPGFEADDILGTVSRIAAEKGDHSYIVTGDRDSLQLISDSTTVILAKTTGDIEYTPSSFAEEYGVTPKQYIDVKALMGDSSDNIPGVAGIGEKTAFKLIRENGSLDKLYASLDTAELKPAVKTKLQNGRDNAILSRELAEISLSAPLQFSLDECKNIGYNNSELLDIFTELEFTAYISKFALSPKESQVNAEAEPSQSEPTPKSVAGAELDALSADMLYVALSEENGKLEIAFDSELYVADISACRNEISALLARCKSVCHDHKALLHALQPADAPICEFDTMLAAYLLSPGNNNYPISDVYAKYLPANTKYSSPAFAVSQLYPILRDKLEAEGMTALMSDVELPLSRVLFDMEEAGVLLDKDGLRNYISELTEALEQLRARIYMAAGTEFNINSTKQLGELLYDKMMLPTIKKTKTGYSTDAETLQKLEPYSPIIRDILDYRQLSKLIGTYGENLIALADDTSRIHTSFNQCGTATGRLSSSDPNMQNIPVRGQLGREIRKFFKSHEGYVFIDADYSQIELRLLAALSGDENMISAFASGRDIHAETAAQVFRIPSENVTPELRTKAKAVNFGIMYGIGDYSLSQDLKISRKKAAEYIADYLAAYPQIDSYLKKTVETAKANGYTTTLLSRKRYIPELAAQNKNLRAFGERVAMNSPIQGGAADIIKLAMINTSRALKDAGLDAKLVLQVHDELIIEAAEKDAEKAARILAEEMQNAADLKVAMSVDIGAGKSWFDAKN